MDPERFDALVQSLASPGSRRRFLGGVLAGAVAPLTAAAKPRRHRKPKPCLAVGKRCTAAAGSSGEDAPQGKRKGKHRPPSCTKCCSGLGGAGADGKTACVCKEDGASCVDPAECCGGDCASGICGSCPSPCASGQRCKNGACVCDGVSCPSGCCQNQTCQTGRSGAACGSGGAACQACGECQQCSGNACVAAHQGECCASGTGVCANGQCVACANGQHCAGEGCVCDQRSCPDGCCQANACQPGTSDAACGMTGDLCRICTAPQTCGGGGTPGQCGCTDEPVSTTCGGKCGTVKNNCGRNVDCTRACAGCCNRAVCQDGTDDGACGANGALCQVCPPPQTCGGGGFAGKCGCTPNCAGKGCGADNGCGGKCGCPHDSPICLNDSQPSCCCPDNGVTNVCVANEEDASVVCCCPSIGGPTPYCRLAPSGKQCCCTLSTQVCTDDGCVAG